MVHRRHLIQHKRQILDLLECRIGEDIAVPGLDHEGQGLGAAVALVLVVEEDVRVSARKKINKPRGYSDMRCRVRHVGRNRKQDDADWRAIPENLFADHLLSTACQVLPPSSERNKVPSVPTVTPTSPANATSVRLENVGLETTGVTAPVVDIRINTPSSPATHSVSPEGPGTSDA